MTSIEASHLRDRARKLREEIEQCDVEILRLANRRARVVWLLLPVKAELGMPLDEEEEERRVDRVLVGLNEGPLKQPQIGFLFEMLRDLTQEKLT